eukprot:5784344-Pleurochrysis_carterae.AAC.2
MRGGNERRRCEEAIEVAMRGGDERRRLRKSCVRDSVGTSARRALRIGDGRHARSSARARPTPLPTLCHACGTASLSLRMHARTLAP